MITDNLPKIRFSRMRWGLLPGGVLEILSRLTGWGAELVIPGSGYSVETKARARLTNLRLGTGLQELGRGVVLARPNRISLGQRTSLRNNVVIMPGGGFFTMGAESHISHHVVIAAAGGVSIGSDCAISSGVIIYSITNQRPDEGALLTKTAPLKEPVSIGNHVHVGANVTILPGITIGDHAVIGAGAVVTRDVAPNTVVVGVPARELDRQINAIS